MLLNYMQPFRIVGDDYPTAFIPQLWANESLAILEENMVVANLVHRDFEDIIANYGDTVNTRKPGEFVAVRKGVSDQITVQANTAVNVPVVLNQNIHTSFLIRDADQSKSFKDLIVEYLRPAMLSIARQVDQIVTMQMHQFYANSSGHLNGLNATNAEQYLLEARQVLNKNKAYVDGRNLVLGSISETALLSNQQFTSAYAVGDDGTALREASLGRKFAFDIFMAQNTPYVGTSGAAVTGAINATAGYNPGATTVTVSGFVATIPVNAWFTIAGDDTPLRVVSTVGGATPTSITFNRPLTHPVVNAAAVTVYTPVTNSGAQMIGYTKALTLSSVAGVSVGMPVSFGNVAGVGSIYGVIAITGNTILLDRPLEEVVSDGANVNLGPTGSYNFAFHKNAISLVNRPLALPMPGTGVRAAIAQWNGLSMRVTMAYDPYNQGQIVTVDTLLGVKVLDVLLGAPMFG